MCGIYGIVGEPKQPRRVAALMTALALHTVPRGEHSMGYFAVTKEENVLEKAAIHPREFLRMSSMVSVVNKDKAYIVMGHNRWASIGDVTNENAHPFEAERWVLAHNGTCPEALRMCRDLGIINKMNGTTDSEAILMLLEHHHNLQGMAQLMSQLRYFSLSIIDKTTETLYFARSDSKPLFVADLRKLLNIRAWASTVEIMASALRTVKIDPGTVTGFNTRPGIIYKVSLGSKLEFEHHAKFTIKPAYVSYPTVTTRRERRAGGAYIPWWKQEMMDEDEKMPSDKDPEVDEDEDDVPMYQRGSDFW